MLNVLVNGAKGNMGSESVLAIQGADDMTLVAALDKEDNLLSSLKQFSPDVVLDFTHPSVVFENAKSILQNAVNVVIGTTGLSESQQNELHEIAIKQDVAVFICPNFSIGAILMMQAATKAAKWMSDVEILEYHHPNKADAPSGTAIRTAELIAESNPNINPNLEALHQTELMKGARGASHHRVPIHSMRLPGFVADQTVLFGALGQRLRIQHESWDRKCYMPGVLLAIRRVGSMKGLKIGLELVLDQ